MYPANPRQPADDLIDGAKMICLVWPGRIAVRTMIVARLAADDPDSGTPARAVVLKPAMQDSALTSRAYDIHGLVLVIGFSTIPGHKLAERSQIPRIQSWGCSFNLLPCS
jgi:hypothetical protein